MGLNEDTSAALEAQLRQCTAELAATRRRLLNTEQRYHSLERAITSIVWDTPASGEFESDQPGWSDFTGQSFDQLRGWGWLNAVHPDDRAHTACVWSAAVASRCIYEVEHRLHRHDGVYRLMAVRAVPILDEDGSIREWVGVHTDITEQKQAEQLLRESKDAAEAANRIKSEFLANMSHELRTPLNSVIGFSNIMLKNKAGNLREQDMTYLTRILENGKHLLGLINTVLDLSKIEAGRAELEIVPVALDGLIQDTLQGLEGRVLDREVKLLADLRSACVTIETDACKLKQVLINLIGNALKFTERGTITVSVAVDAHDSRPLRIDVSDTGIGIPADKLETIFEAFRQADAGTERKYGGTGLGLTISRALCRLLDYRLTVASTVGKGTVFSILLAPEAEPPAGPEQASGYLPVLPGPCSPPDTAEPALG
jgi:PAS domain S-box-containing protein